MAKNQKVVPSKLNFDYNEEMKKLEKEYCLTCYQRKCICDKGVKDSIPKPKNKK